MTGPAEPRLAPRCSGWHCVALALLLGWGLALPAWGAGITLNLKDADIEQVINTVADITGKNFIVDPRVKGKVTIISSTPLDREAVYRVFLSVLDVHGFAAVTSGDVIKVVPDATAKQSGIPTLDDGGDDLGDEVVTQVITIHNVGAAQLVPILRPLVAQQGHMAAYPPSNALIIADRASNIRRIASIIRRIDRPTEGDVEFIPLEHASAAEVVRILGSVAQGDPKDPSTPKPTLVADERTNSVIIGGEKDTRVRLRAIITHLDTPTETSGNTQVIYLRYAKAKDLVPVLTGIKDLPGAKGGKPQEAAKDVTIQADETTNALVITAPPDQMRALLEVVRKLDIRRAQVLVEAIIAEMQTNRAKDLGVEWAVLSRSGGFALGTNLSGNLVGVLTGVAQGGDFDVGDVSVPDGFIAGGADVDAEDPFAVLLRALATDDSTNILSTPSIITMDNEEAEIVVAENVPFVTGSFSTADTGGNPFQTIQRQDVGLTLKVKPQINEGNAVRLEVEQETSSLGQQSVGAAQDVSTNKRSIKTVVMVDDGQIVVLGGQIQDQVQESASKVPLLGDIPLLGALFRNQSSELRKTILMVFLHPVILRSAEDNERISGGKYNYVRALQAETQERGVGLFPFAEVPMLPQVDQYLELPPSFEEMSGAGGGAQ